MDDLDPAQADSLDELAECLRQLRLRADTPSFRLLEERTKHANEFLPGTRIERVALRRSTLSEVLQGQTFPKKAFLLTFVEACGVDLKADRRWEQAWDRLATQAQYQEREMAMGNSQRELDELRRQLAEAKRRAEAAEDLAKASVASSVRTGPPIVPVDGGEALVYSTRDLSKQTERVMTEIEEKPAFITRHGRFVAIIRSLAPGEVERVLFGIAHEIGKREGA
jgi:hypothetical protein